MKKNFKESVDQLADQLIDSMSLSYRSEVEPFERYAERQRASLHELMETYRERFANGYVAILKEIKREGERDA